jgi:hypothetical protein
MESELDVPCPETGRPCAWVIVEELNAAGEVLTRDYYCETCHRWYTPTDPLVLDER